MGATLTFSEEFDALRFWDGTTGLDARPAWGLHDWAEQGFSYGTDTWYMQPGTQAYAAAGAFATSGGVLTLTARKAGTPYYYADGNGGAHHYTSGMVTTAHEFSQTYGYFELRAEISETAGTLPAFWLMPVNHPTDGSFASELDVMEILGSDPTTLYTTVHSAVAGADRTGAQHFQTLGATTILDASTGFHTYGVDWEADKITWYLNGRVMFQTDTPPDMHGPHYLIANLDGPAGWQGQPDSSQLFEPTFKIDYIRAYSSMPIASATVEPSVSPQSAGDNVAAPATTDRATFTTTAATTSTDTHATVTPATASADTHTTVTQVTTPTDTHTTVTQVTTPTDIQATVPFEVTLNETASNGVLLGETENDHLVGGARDDLLIGFGGDDVLSGGDGNDILIGGTGNNTLTGGVGADSFVFGPGGGTDHVLDFDVRQGDRIDLTCQSYVVRDLGSGTIELDLSGGGHLILEQMTTALSPAFFEV